ncbi:hypothetical protein SAMN05421785_103287 [Chryseobacterium gambrini]|uniref:Uncharacterized protein n=1 Tax=Chryseobacterium gambrini TaxID=373672 RepID=A0A1N7MK19_9FLAO|nr:hypothetical protein SAMN05421785_103287 [Chryseobacterium gambrini]
MEKEFCFLSDKFELSTKEISDYYKNDLNVNLIYVFN